MVFVFITEVDVVREGIIDRSAYFPGLQHSITYLISILCDVIKIPQIHQRKYYLPLNNT